MVAKSIKLTLFYNECKTIARNIKRLTYTHEHGGVTNLGAAYLILGAKDNEV